MTATPLRVLFAGLLAAFAAAPLAAQAPKAPAADKLTFEVYKDNAGEFRWRLKDADGNLGTSGQGYKAKADAKAGAERIKADAATLKFEVYQDAGKKYRWRVFAKNGNNIGSSSGSFADKAEADKAVQRIKDHAAKAEVVDATAK